MEDNFLRASEILKKISSNIENVIKGKSESIKFLLCSFASGGHILLNDYPGTGKTTLAKALSLSIDAGFKRIQFTPDLLPSDILGVSIYNQKSGDFEFHEGPIFTNILLADEINRASPRTQSALLEAMAEEQVSIDKKNMKLNDLFFVIATQNPVESHGVYPLPEAQIDRFAMELGLGYVSIAHEVEILNQQTKVHPINSVKPCVTLEDIKFLKETVNDVKISEELKYYIVNIVNATRNIEGVTLGASPRASLALMKAAKVLALFDGFDFVIPDYIQELAPKVIAHRLVLDSTSKFSGKTASIITQDIVKNIAAPI